MTTYQKQDPKSIQTLFQRIAPTYDLTNGILSFRLHKWWNRSLIKHCKQATKVPAETTPVYVDLCAGTGDISDLFLKKEARPFDVHLLDFCSGMLEVAKDKLATQNYRHHNIHYVCGDAQDLPFDSDSTDFITVAYGIRNVKEPKLCIAEAYRILRPGGVFGILELTRPTNPALRLFHKIYLKNVLPTIGKIVASDKSAYEYLCNTINSFITAETLSKHMNTAGFKNIRCLPLSGGIATIVLGVK